MGNYAIDSDQLVNLFDFAVAVIRLFSPQALGTGRRGPGFIQRPPEAQYRDEFYRCSHQYSKGSLESDIPNLYHVVFSPNFRTVAILNNNLKHVHGFASMTSS